MDYPKHLSEKIRQEVAISYIQHLAKQLFPSLAAEERSKLNQDMDGWSNGKLMIFPRDFWDGFHGLSMGFKLNIGLSYIITAENVKWSRTILKIADLKIGMESPEAKDFKPGKVGASELLDFCEKNSDIKEKWRKQWSAAPEKESVRNGDPIIVTKRWKDNEFVWNTLEGNNRVVWAILNDKKEIEAFLGEFDDKQEQPKNYWLPTSFLMDMIYFVYRAIREKDDSMFNKYIEILKDMLKDSESGKIEFKERALTSKPEYVERILKAINL